MFRSGENSVIVDYGAVLATTDKAILIVVSNADDDEVWIPRSVITTLWKPSVGKRNGEVRVMEWFARKNNIPYRALGTK